MNTTLTILRTILVLLLLSWLMVWILSPTKLYQLTWRPKLTSKLSTTYLREQGTYLVLFTCPMMVISAVGCLYLHLQNNNKRRNLKKMRSRPVVVMSPLGIVTSLELTFGFMFIALLVWSFTQFLLLSFSHLQLDHHKVWEEKLEITAVIIAVIGNICWAFLFFPVTRASSILPLIGLTSESSIKYHIWLGHISNALFALHAIGYIIYWAVTNQMSQIIEWSKTGVSNLAGVIAIVMAMVIWVTSIPQVRRKKFEVFFYTHHLYILYIIFYILHAGVRFFCTIFPGIFLFVIDRYLRFLQSKNNVRVLNARVLPCNTIELTFSKSRGLCYNPTSILFMNVPSISKIQWHPFTVISNANMEEDKLSVLIKVEGSWTHKLYQQISSSSIDHKHHHLEVSVEGPYGPTSSHFLRYESLVMISGGSGIAPLISIIREFTFQTTKPNPKIPTINLICAFKNSSDISMLNLLLPISNPPTHLPKLNINIYITRESQNPKTKSNPIETIRFEPNPLDSPISPILGPKSWLWLGLIITSSFLMFVLLLGIVTRFYIYPIEKNGVEVYHFSYKCLWDMFLVCGCVCVVSSFVFLWRKKEINVMEGKQVNEFEVSEMTQISSVRNGDEELEGFSSESLILDSTVYYGGRPNLKKILLDVKGSEVGVMVCGPKKMRHEVAEICSSKSAHNLHFESISFNW